MPTRTKLLAATGIPVVVILAWALSPWADAVAFVLVLGIAPASTLFALIYGLTVSWWETLIGKAMLISSCGLALLVDISLLYQWLGDDYAARDVVRNSVYTVIFLGAWFKLGALVREKYRSWRDHRRSAYDA